MRFRYSINLTCFLLFLSLMVDQTLTILSGFMVSPLTYPALTNRDHFAPSLPGFVSGAGAQDFPRVIQVPAYPTNIDWASPKRERIRVSSFSGPHYRTPRPPSPHEPGSSDITPSSPPPTPATYPRASHNRCSPLADTNYPYSYRGVLREEKTVLTGGQLVFQVPVPERHWGGFQEARSSAQADVHSLHVSMVEDFQVLRKIDRTLHPRGASREGR